MTKEWSREECIKAFQDLSESCQDKVITRDFFRKNSDCPEYHWSRYFGTFSEFKTQAGYDISSHQAKLLNYISKHSDKDKLRTFTKEKQQYEGKYLKPDNKRFQTVMLCSDTHDVNCDKFYLETFIDTVKRIQPETVILAGDILDNVEFSRHYNDPREYKLVERIKWLHTFLENIRNVAPDTQIDYLSGNHDEYLLRHLCESSPQILTLLSDIHGHTISSLLGIDKYEVNFISRNDLSVFTDYEFKAEVRKNHILKFNCLHVNHYPIKNPATPCVWGHHHKYISVSHYNPVYGSFHAVQLGTGHKRYATYCNAEAWNQGWMIAHVDTDKLRVQFEYVDVTNDSCMIGGKWYNRT